jgi:hypothetical protein
MMFDYHSLNSIYFMRSKSSTPLKANGIKPKLCSGYVTLHVYVWRFFLIARIKKNRYGPALSTVGIKSFISIESQEQHCLI